MYRIVIARSGSYFVQQRGIYGWKKVGGFFYTRAGARSFARSLRNCCIPPYNSRVVEYL